MKLDIKKANTALSKMTGRPCLVLKKHSPEILLVVGIGGIVGATVLACKGTLRAKDILDKTKEEIAEIKDEDSIDIMTVDEEKKAIGKVYIKCGLEVAKEYAPAIGLGVAGITCVVGSHGIMKKRTVSLIAAYNAVEKGFSEYRERVIEAIGEDKELDIRHGVTKEKVTEIEVDEETGKEKKVKKTIDVIDPEVGCVSQYARFFDDSCAEWSNSPEYNLCYLLGQQQQMNDLLHSRGHVFLNEVYDALGIKRTQAGAIVGWVENGDGDGYIDFGIYDVKSNPRRDFVNGYESSILLDFNVDGVIYDLI